MLRTGGEDALTRVSDRPEVGLERLEQLQVDEVTESRVLTSLSELLGDGVQLLRDLPALGEDEYHVRARETDRAQARCGQAGELLFARVQRRDLELQGGQ
jgi:hypothetical protein